MAGEDEAPDSAAESLPPKRTRLGFDPRSAGVRLLLALVVGGLSMLLTPENVALHIRSMVGWDSSALVYLVLSWLMIVRASPEETRRRAALEDPGRRVVFAIAIGSSIFSLFAAVGVLRELRGLPPTQAHLWPALALGAVVLSWLVTHTAFTLRYAHLYYRRKGATHCLRFEGTDEPCDFDFAYFAFTIGMCFQVSDVVISSSRVRRQVLVHSLISFAYNTTILALALNLVTTLLS